MFTVIIIMLAGMGLGYVLRAGRFAFVRCAVTVLVWLLLFLLGVEVGTNPRVVGGIGRLGAEAAVLAVAGVLGSAVMAWVLYRVVRGSRDDDGDGGQRA